jgi:CelD/BcsL family acetyltransferase involved in cellulose biosynthesis
MTSTAALARDLPQRGNEGRATATRCIGTLPALERELADGLLASWKALVQDDPLASCFQAPGWCVPWYRSYHDEYDPYVIVVTSGRELVGLVPLAVHRATREIGFASGTMADYRDVVSAPGVRAHVVAELIRVYLAGRFPNPLQIGWIDPASDTPSLVARACRAQRVPFVSWQQPCHRWTPVDGENLTKKFSRIRTHLNHFKRLGDVTFDVVETPEEWAAFRDRFFEQHSLRQLQADRAISFDDPRKRRFYDRLFDSPMVRTHATALRLDGQMLSGHIGFVWRDVLMLGAPSISIEHEQRSPALILLSWVMQNADSLGLKGFDLTIGDTEFKRRLGNHRVAVTSIEVYGRRRSYYARSLRLKSAALAKKALSQVSDNGAWGSRVRPMVDRLSRHVTVAREQGIIATLRGLAAGNRRTRSLPASRVITRQEVDADDMALPPSWRFRENRIEDLLLWTGGDRATAQAIRGCARIYARQRALGAAFHTTVAGERLAAWCFSQVNADRETTITHLHVTPEFADERASERLLTHVARAAFASGTEIVRVGPD